jgi:hypothetical protein
MVEELAVRNSRFSVKQIVPALKQAELGMPVADLLPGPFLDGTGDLDCDGAGPTLLSVLPWLQPGSRVRVHATLRSSSSRP